jgi:hypothetical protein
MTLPRRARAFEPLPAPALLPDWSTIIRMAMPGDTVRIGDRFHAVRARCGIDWDSFFCLTCRASIVTLEELEQHLELEGGHVIAGRCELHGLECRGSSK